MIQFIPIVVAGALLTLYDRLSGKKAVSPLSPWRHKSPTPPADVEIEIIEDRTTEESTLLLGIEEVPLDNRFGSQVLESRHTFSRRAMNRFELDLGHEQHMNLRLGGKIMPHLLADAGARIRRATGLEIGSELQRSLTLTLAASPGKISRYRICWKQQVRNGRYRLRVDGKEYLVPYVIHYDLSHEVTSIAHDEPLADDTILL
ncbi:MAG: hypothetical protein HQL49_09090 [Gammaproteobacteria bacterium]|nr:hypothetical protein [Gammaproteobacteria bacterium]